MPKCHICKKPFVKIRGIQPTCNEYDCKVAYATNVANKAIEREKKKQKKQWAEEKKVLAEKTTNWKSKLQTKVQEIARLIDKGLKCPSKGTYSKQDGGHVFSKGSHKEMRFNLHNIHRQSAQSNHWDNDDVGFRKGLIKEYGQEYFDFIESLVGNKVPILKDIEYMEKYQIACGISNRLKKQNKEYSLQERIKLRNQVNIEIGIYQKQYCEFVL